MQNRGYFLAYAVWLSAAALGALPLFYGPPAVASVMSAFGLNRWVVSAFQRFGFVLLGLGWMIGVLYAEHYLRNSVSRGHLGRAMGRVFMVTGIIVLLFLLLLVLPFFLLRS